MSQEVVIVTSSGKQYQSVFSPSMTISSLKSSLETAYGFPEQHQTLIYKGRKLQNKSTFQEIGVVSGDKVYLLIVNNALRQVFVRLEGKMYTVDVTLQDSVGTVKKLLGRKVRKELRDYEVYDRYRPLKNEAQRLEDAGIQGQSLLDCLPLPRYGA